MLNQWNSKVIATHPEGGCNTFHLIAIQIVAQIACSCYLT